MSLRAVIGFGDSSSLHDVESGVKIIAVPTLAMIALGLNLTLPVLLTLV